MANSHAIATITTTPSGDSTTVGELLLFSISDPANFAVGDWVRCYRANEFDSAVSRARNTVEFGITGILGSQVTAVVVKTASPARQIKAGDVFDATLPIGAQFFLPTPTRAGLIAAIAAFPTRVLTWPEGNSYQWPDQTTPATWGPSNSGGGLIIPASSQITPASGSGSLRIFQAFGALTGSQYTVSTYGRDDTVLTIAAGTTGLAIDDYVLISATEQEFGGGLPDANGYKITRLRDVQATTVTLLDPMCFQSVESGIAGNHPHIRLQKFNPITNFTFKIGASDGSGATGTANSVLHTKYCVHSNFDVQGQDWSGAGFLHQSGYDNDIATWLRNCGIGAGGSDLLNYGDFYDVPGSTNCRYKLVSQDGAAFGNYSAHAHQGTWERISYGTRGRGNKLSVCCGTDRNASYHAGFNIAVGNIGSGCSYADVCHDLEYQAHIFYGPGFGLIHHDDGGAINYRLRGEVVSRGNGTGGNAATDAYVSGSDVDSYVRMNSDAVITANDGLKHIDRGKFESRPSFSAGNFVGVTGTWTLTSGDVSLDVHRKQQKAVRSIWKLDATTSAGGCTALRITLPYSMTLARDVPTRPCLIYEDTSVRPAIIFGTSGNTYVEIQREDGMAIANLTNLLHIRAEAEYEVT